MFDVSPLCVVLYPVTCLKSQMLDKKVWWNADNISVSTHIFPINIQLYSYKLASLKY